MLDDKSLTQQEREKIIEVLLSQERVLTLLYDKTFPPRPATAKVGLRNAFSQGKDDAVRDFNYYGQLNQEVDDIEDADVDKLEKEIEEVLKNRTGVADITGKFSNGIINISKGDNDRQKSAVDGKRNLMSAAYRQNKIDNTADMGEDIYEDEESSGEEND